MNRSKVAAAAPLIGVAAVLLSGVASRAVPAWNYEARIAGIPVADSTGHAMATPFLGGFDVPRPQLVDINGDGKLDLFIQERSNELMYFERVGDVWEWRTDRYQNLSIGEWYRFVDIDGDGLTDLLAEKVSGYARALRNAGTKTEPRFVAMGDSIRDVDGQAILVDRQNILNAVDIDCNKKLDLFIGRVQGVVDRFEQEGYSPDGSPRFRLIEERWQGIEVLGPEVTGVPLRRTDTLPVPFADVPNTERAFRHGANTLAFADVDGRGLYDLFWGDFFEEGLLQFHNTGSCPAPDLSGTPTRFPPDKPVLTSGYNAPSFGDADGDGNIDLVVGVIGGAYGPARTSIDNLWLVEQKPKGTWTAKTRRLIPTIDVGAEAAPALGDLNGDGLADLIVGSKISVNDGGTGTLTWWENVGTKTAPSFRERGALPIKGDYNYAPAIVDLDGDGSNDLVLGTWRDQVQWYRNTGSRTAPTWTLADTALVTITRGTNTTPTFGDLDGDGLLDLLVGEASGTINLYRNIGTRSAPKFELVSDHFQDIKIPRRSAPLLVDMDHDGKLDMLMGGGGGEIELWRGAGSGRDIRFVRDETFALKSYGTAAPAVADLHGTGKLDLLVGTSAGGIRWFAPNEK